MYLHAIGLMKQKRWADRFEFVEKPTNSRALYIWPGQRGSILLSTNRSVEWLKWPFWVTQEPNGSHAPRIIFLMIWSVSINPVLCSLCNMLKQACHVNQQWQTRERTSSPVIRRLSSAEEASPMTNTISNLWNSVNTGTMLIAIVVPMLQTGSDEIMVGLNSRTTYGTQHSREGQWFRLARH